MAKAIRSLLPAALALLLLAPGAAEAGPPRAKAAVIGGADVAITAYPHQAALLNRQALEAGQSPWLSQFCGAFILDEKHVGTAAHCVVDEGPDGGGDATNDSALPPAAFKVLVGTDHLRIDEAPAATEQLLDVEAVSFRPGFDPVRFDDDAAILRLADPIALDGTTRKAIPLRSAGSPLGIGADVSVSGWGLVEGGTAPQQLRAVTLDVVADNAPICDGAYAFYAPQRMLCATRFLDADTARDSCSGDSGGPLVTTPVAALAGIVSFGADCGNPQAAGVYAEVWKNAPGNEIDEFLEGRPITPAPQPAGPHTLDGVAQPGQVLTCTAPWDGASIVEYQVQGPANVAREVASTDPAYVVQAADAGLTLTCLSRARSDGGYGYARSAPVTVTAAPAPAPAPPVAPPVNLQPPAPRDTARPRSKVARKRCTKTVCTLQVQVTDPPPTSGIRTLRGSGKLSYRSTCKRKGRRRACTRTRSLSVKPSHLGAGRYLVRVRSRTAGRAVLRFVAYDVAGNRQAKATQVTVRYGATAKRKKSGARR